MIELLRARLHASARGQAAVETALILSIVMVLALGTLDLGRGIAAHIALAEATQEGAMVAGYRYYDASDTPNWGTLTNLENLIRTSSSADAVENAAVTVSTCGDVVTVTSSYAMPVLTPLASLIFGPTIGVAVQIDATNFHHEDC